MPKRISSRPAGVCHGRSVSWGEPAEHVEGERTSKQEQEALVGSQPETFAVSAYTGRFGWVTARLENADPEEVRELVIDCWRRTAAQAGRVQVGRGAAVRTPRARRALAGQCARLGHAGRHRAAAERR
jgi:hypothetical protein